MWLDPVVQELVTGEVMFVFELLVTDVTLVLPLVLVSQLVSVQRGSLSEFLPTQVADMRLLTRVNVGVVQQLVGCGEQSLTLAALVSLAAVVTEEVRLRVGGRVASRAEETGVSRALVSLQLQAASELYIRQVTAGNKTGKCLAGLWFL